MPTDKNSGAYIFLTNEGFTYQPGSESPEPDVENCQLLGIALGRSPREALKRLVAENQYLLSMTFDEVYCYPLANGFSAGRATFYLSDIRAANSQQHA